MFQSIKDKFFHTDASGKTVKQRQVRLEDLPSPDKWIVIPGQQKLPKPSEIVFNRPPPVKEVPKAVSWIKENLTTEWVPNPFKWNPLKWATQIGYETATAAGDALGVPDIPNPFDWIEKILMFGAIIVGGGVIIYFTAMIRNSLR